MRFTPYTQRFPDAPALPADDEPCPEEWQYGRLEGVVTAEIKARADAEWRAMDNRGRLPEGWEWKPEQGRV